MPYGRDGFLLRRAFVPVEARRRLVAIGERIHALWLREHGEEARLEDRVNSHGLTARRCFPPPHQPERAAFFDALANDALCGLLTAQFGDTLYFHGTQMFFNPLGGAREPCWHRDIQYNALDEAGQQALFADLCHLHIRLALRPERDFMLVPGSHLRWDSPLERDVRLERGGHRSSEALPSARAFDLRPGDALIFSAHMLHRGTYAGNADRLSLDLLLAQPHAEFGVLPNPDQLPGPDELDRIGHPRWYELAHALLRPGERAD